MKHVLTIAGSDPSGGAGIQADLKTMCALGVYGMSVITAVTVQNTRKVYAVQEIMPDIVAGQIDAVFEDIAVHAVKIGMVSDAGIIRVIRDRLLAHHATNIVVDPVMVSKSGYHLLRPEAEEAIRELLAIADITTPNLPEAEVLTGSSIDTESDMESAAQTILAMGPKAVLVKGGHLQSSANDFLLTGHSRLCLQAARIPTANTHGTGCTLSSAIACGLASGLTMDDAVLHAKTYVNTAIQNALDIGSGPGPLGHLTSLYEKARLADKNHPNGRGGDAQ